MVYREFLCGVVDNDVGVLAGSDLSHFGAAEYFCGIGGAKLNRFLKAYYTVVCLAEHVGIHVLNSRAAVGYLAEVVEPPVLFALLERAVVSGDGIDVAASDGFPDSVL